MQDRAVPLVQYIRLHMQERLLSALYVNTRPVLSRGAAILLQQGPRACACMRPRVYAQIHWMPQISHSLLPWQDLHSIANFVLCSGSNTPNLLESLILHGSCSATFSSPLPL